MKEDSRQKTRTRGQLCFWRNKEQPVYLNVNKIFEGRKTEALYLWFLFMNQPDMAKYLCSRSQVRQTPYYLQFGFVSNYLSMSCLMCQNQTVATLLAVKIYFKAAKIMENKQSLKEIGK
jgi:hypothetical protein